MARLHPERALEACQRCGVVAALASEQPKTHERRPIVGLCVLYRSVVLFRLIEMREVPQRGREFQA